MSYYTLLTPVNHITLSHRLDDVLKKLKGESIDSDSLFGILQSAVSQLEKFADSVKVNVKAVKLSILDFIQSFSFSCECLLSNDDNPEISSIAESLKTALT